MQTTEPGTRRTDSSEADSLWAEVAERLRFATAGEFEIGRELGRGGMAAVFLAHETSLHRDVAIKVMSPSLLMGEGMIERFKREAITIAHLNHPNIVSVYSVRAAEGLHFFVMRCIQGRSLEQVIKQAGRLPVPIVRSILYQVGSALAYAHRSRVVHRDIKPANILIDEDGNAVVTDFGIAKAAEAPSTTNTGFMVGTPAYMSPEQCSGGGVSGASDQYALGAVAYEMIAGVPPFTGSTYSVIQAHVERSPRPVREHCPDCPPELETAILRMLAKEPRERWPGMARAIGALGATTLSEDDPLRAELSRLAVTVPAMSSSAATPSKPWHPSHSSVLPTTPTGMVRAITILPPPPALEVGDTFLLVARVHEGPGAQLPRRAVEWKSDTPGVLRVNPTKAVATAISPGSALITATCEGSHGRLRVTVTPPRADTIVIKSLDKPITVGDEVRLEASSRDKRGRPLARPVTWRSGDDAVATLGPDGVLTARSPGSTRVTAELDEASADVTVTVQQPRVAAVHISSPPESVNAGQSFALTVTPLDRWAGPLADRTVEWSVSDVSVAVVTATGWVMTRNPGLVVLTATCEGVSASVSVNVLPRVATHQPDVQPVESGARAPSGDGPWDLDTEEEDSRREWVARRRTSTRRRWVISAAGLGLAAGGFWLARERWGTTPPPPETAAVTRESVPFGGSVAAPTAPGPVPAVLASDSSADTAARPIASAPIVASLSITPPESLRVGDTTRLRARALDDSGKVLRSRKILWRSSEPGIAQVEAGTGRVRAVSPGTVNITARSDSSTAVAALTVLPAAVAAVRIEGAHPLKAGDTLTLRAEPRDAGGASLSDRAVVWASTDSAVAAVDSVSGVVIARGPGSVRVTATSEGRSGSVIVIVVPELRIGRSGPPPEEPEARAGGSPPEATGVDPKQLTNQLVAGVEQCYEALRLKDVARVTDLYQPASRADREKLKKLSRILRTQEWAAEVGKFESGAQRLDADVAAMDFTVRLTWKDAFGGRRSSSPAFRVEFAKNGDGWDMSSCRIIGSPKL